tara:strand:+ start:1928 stop:2254 length:327 start_codon:yes stop_codon:yes gene_type:complete
MPRLLNLTNITNQPIEYLNILIFYPNYDNHGERYYLNQYKKMQQANIDLFNLFLFGMLISCLFCNCYRQPNQIQSKKNYKSKSKLNPTPKIVLVNDDTLVVSGKPVEV